MYAEEALHRLVEIYYILGLKEESERYAQLLGYNYQSSKWYEKTYSIFNQMYEENKIKRTNKKNNVIIRKFKSLLN
jgi:outer membrane protein assembly factor BamD